MRKQVLRFWAAALLASPAFTAPAMAADAATAPPRRVPLAVTAAALSAQAGADAVEDAASKPTAEPAQGTPKSFWKSRKGILTGVLLAGGIGWVIYSKSNDRVKSPASE